MFIDRMNGIEHKEVSYHNTGLYLYCYAQDGELFLHFISLNEYAIIKALSKDYTLDEVEAAVLDLAMGRDMTEICKPTVSRLRRKGSLKLRLPRNRFVKCRNGHINSG